MTTEELDAIRERSTRDWYDEFVDDADRDRRALLTEVDRLRELVRHMGEDMGDQLAEVDRLRIEVERWQGIADTRLREFELWAPNITAEAARVRTVGKDGTEQQGADQ